MNTANKILIVDDDLKLRELLKKFLTENSYMVNTVENTTLAEKQLSLDFYDIMILDMMMPGENGLDFCKRLRKHDHPIPIIMLSARGDDIDKIIGLEIGVDDYLAKPFNPRELLARIRAILRRNRQIQTHQESKVYKVGDFEFDLQRRLLQKPSTPSIQLSSTEYDLMKVFVENPGKPLSRNQLMNLLHAKDFEIFDRSIDVLVSRLRKHIEKDLSQPQLIQTVWGVGYVFTAPQQNSL
jgi:two-component system phosphate regulon response regulator OmpR